MNHQPQPLAALAEILDADRQRGIDPSGYEATPTPPPTPEPAPFIIDPPPWSDHYRGDHDQTPS